MLDVLKAIDKEKELLEKHKFFKLLRSSKVSDTKKLVFAPRMFFYVLAFRDLLSILYKKQTKSRMEKMINAYVSEDGTHYRWYLDDLKKLGYENIKARDIWQQEDLDVRKAIYRMIGLALQNPSEEIKIVLIMVFEATGNIFLGHTYNLTKRLGRHKKLVYFGEKHYLDEIDHTVKENKIRAIKLKPSDKKQALVIVKDTFDYYDRLFDCWHRSIATDTRKIKRK